MSAKRVSVWWWDMSDAMFLVAHGCGKAWKPSGRAMRVGMGALWAENGSESPGCLLTLLGASDEARGEQFDLSDAPRKMGWIVWPSHHDRSTNRAEGGPTVGTWVAD